MSGQPGTSTSSTFAGVCEEILEVIVTLEEEFKDIPWIISGSGESHERWPLDRLKLIAEQNLFGSHFAFVIESFEVVRKALASKKSGERHKDAVKFLARAKELMDPMMKKDGFCCGVYPLFRAPPSQCQKCNETWLAEGDPCYKLRHGAYICVNCFNVKQPEVYRSHEFEEVFCCDGCGTKKHKMCEDWPLNGDFCKKCAVVPKKRISAEDLPHYGTSRFIETRVRKMFDTDNLVVRMLSSQRVQCDVPEIVRDAPYFAAAPTERVSKSFYAFWKSDEAETCFFGLHVSEYDEECPELSRMTVVIDYMDSVDVVDGIEPFRRQLFHELIRGYLEYAGLRGFRRGEFFACPPDSADDLYLFNARPTHQRLLDEVALIRWYKSLLEGEFVEKTVQWTTKKIDATTSLSSIPFFHESLWSMLVQDYLKDKAQVEEEEEQNMNAVNEPPAKRRKPLPDTEEGERKKFKNWAKTSQNDGRTAFRFELKTSTDETEQDPVFDYESVMEGRNFAKLAKSSNWEFSTARRAKYATLMMTTKVHEERKAKK